MNEPTSEELELRFSIDDYNRLPWAAKVILGDLRFWITHQQLRELWELDKGKKTA